MSWSEGVFRCGGRMGIMWWRRASARALPVNGGLEGVSDTSIRSSGGGGEDAMTLLLRELNLE